MMFEFEEYFNPEVERLSQAMMDVAEDMDRAVKKLRGLPIEDESAKVANSQSIGLLIFYANMIRNKVLDEG